VSCSLQIVEGNLLPKLGRFGYELEKSMLGIREQIRQSNVVHLRLDGKLNGEWVQELADLCDQYDRDGRVIVLDVSGVTFADSEGITLLQEFLKNGIEITNRSLFLDLLVREADESSVGGIPEASQYIADPDKADADRSVAKGGENG